MPTEFDRRGQADDEEGDETFYAALYPAVVVDNKDPEEVGRVKMSIRGFVDRSAWATPAALGGGSKGRGFYDPPDEGADVLVMFIEGDIEQPVYFGGFWGIPDAGRETPGPFDNVGAAERPKIKAYETSRYLLLFDHRNGNEAMTFRDKTTGDVIVFDSAGIKLATALATERALQGDAFHAAASAYVAAIDAFAATTTGTAPPLATAGVTYLNAITAALSARVKVG